MVDFMVYICLLIYFLCLLSRFDALKSRVPGAINQSLSLLGNSAVQGVRWS